MGGGQKRDKKSTSDGGRGSQGPVVQIQVFGHRTGFEGPAPASCCYSCQSPAATWGSDLPRWGSRCRALGTESGTLRGVMPMSWASPSWPLPGWPPGLSSLHQAMEAETIYSKG